MSGVLRVLKTYLLLSGGMDDLISGHHRLAE